MSPPRVTPPTVTPTGEPDLPDNFSVATTAVNTRPSRRLNLTTQQQRNPRNTPTSVLRGLPPGTRADGGGFQEPNSTARRLRDHQEREALRNARHEVQALRGGQGGIMAMQDSIEGMHRSLAPLAEAVETLAGEVSQANLDNATRVLLQVQQQAEDMARHTYAAQEASAMQTTNMLHDMTGNIRRQLETMPATGSIGEDQEMLLDALYAPATLMASILPPHHLRTLKNALLDASLSRLPDFYAQATPRNANKLASHIARRVTDLVSSYEHGEIPSTLLANARAAIQAQKRYYDGGRLTRSRPIPADKDFSRALEDKLTSAQRRLLRASSGQA